MSDAIKPGENGSDFANILVTLLGVVFILAALWLGEVLSADRFNHDPGLGSETSPPKAMVHVN